MVVAPISLYCFQHQTTTVLPSLRAFFFFFNRKDKFSEKNTTSWEGTCSSQKHTVKTQDYIQEQRESINIGREPLNVSPQAYKLYSPVIYQFNGYCAHGVLQDLIPFKKKAV